MQPLSVSSHGLRTLSELLFRPPVACASFYFLPVGGGFVPTLRPAEIIVLFFLLFASAGSALLRPAPPLHDLTHCETALFNLTALRIRINFDTAESAERGGGRLVGASDLTPPPRRGRRGVALFSRNH